MKPSLQPILLLLVLAVSFSTASIDSGGDVALIQSRSVKRYVGPQEIMTDAMEKYRQRRGGTAKISGTIKASIKLGLNSEGAHTFLQKDVFHDVLAGVDVNLLLNSVCSSKVLINIAQPKFILSLVKIAINCEILKVTIPAKLIANVVVLPIVSVFLDYLRNLGDLKVLLNGGLSVKLVTGPIIKFIVTMPFLTNFLKVVPIFSLIRAIFTVLTKLKLFLKINPNVVIKICTQVFLSNTIKMLFKSVKLTLQVTTKILPALLNLKVLTGLLNTKIFLKICNPTIVLKIFNLSIIKNLLNPKFILGILNNAAFIKVFIKPTLLADIFGSGLFKILLSPANIAKMVSSTLMGSLFSGGAIKLLVSGGLGLGIGGLTKGIGGAVSAVGDMIGGFGGDDDGGFFGSISGDAEASGGAEASDDDGGSSTVSSDLETSTGASGEASVGGKAKGDAKAKDSNEGFFG